MEDGLSINPVRPRIMNMGHDGSGTRCSSDSKYNVNIYKEKTRDLSFPEKVVPDKIIVKAYNDFHSGTLFKKI